MAATTLTLPASEASAPATMPLPTPGGALLALDLGTTTGWALRAESGLIISGSESSKPQRFEGGGMRYLRFKRWLTDIKQCADGLDWVVFEEVRKHAGVDAAHAYGGFMAHLTAWCEHHVALFCDPTPPITGQTERAQRTGFGIAIKKLRDRVFRIDARQVRVVKAGIEHKATRWKLDVCADSPARQAPEQPHVGELHPSAGNLHSGGPPTQPSEIIGRGEPGEPGEPLPTLTRACVRAHAKDDPDEGSPGSRGSPRLVNSVGYAGEHSGEPPIRGSRGSPPPDWLRELDP